LTRSNIITKATAVRYIIMSNKSATDDNDTQQVTAHQHDTATANNNNNKVTVVGANKASLPGHGWSTCLLCVMIFFVLCGYCRYLVFVLRGEGRKKNGRFILNL
jgi:hypothetical protein